MFKRIVALFLPFVMIVSLFSVGASAEYISKNSTFWEFVMHSAIKATSDVPIVAQGVQGVAAFLESDVCKFSDDGYHYGDILVAESSSSDEHGRLLCKSVCKYCDKTFNCYASDMESAYNSYVTDLNAEFGASFFGEDSQGQYLAMYLPTGINAEGGCMENVSTSDGLSLTASLRGTQVTASDAKCKITLPGFNSPVACQFMTYQLIGVSNFPGAPSITPAYKHSKAPLTKGQFLYLSPAFSLSYYTEQSALPAELYFDYKILGRFYLPTSVSLSDVLDDLNSRPSSITGDYGIIGDNGSIIKVDGNMIVDESSSTVYNPVTNTTLNYTDYAYDYSDRSYNLTLEDGSTMKVTYGDENIIINEGDTIYNVYYMVPESEEDDGGSGSGSDGDTHTHDYTNEITKQPNCLLSGVRTYTCSCGDSYTKAVPATGHDWQISQQVANTYDPETGEQLTTGYTIYTCATCGEQYKSTDGNAPPNGSSGDSDEDGGLISGLFGAVGDVIAGLISGLLSLATKALEALTGLGDLFAQMIETVLGFFGGFIDFLSAMFPFLPEETITILNLGLILMIAAAVFNRFFK